MTTALCIKDLIDVPPVQTVVKLEEGLTQSKAITTSFVFTSEVAAHFTVIAQALHSETGRGYFVQGDFGSGKSHSLAALSAWLADRPGAEILTENHKGLQRLKRTGRHFLPVEVSLLKYRSTTALEQILVTEIEKALTSRAIKAALTPLATFLERLKSILAQPELAQSFAAVQGIQPEAIHGWCTEHPREAYAAGLRFLKDQGLEVPESLVEERHETFARAVTAVRDGGFDGLVLLIDELSEFFRSKPNAQRLNEDARTLQFLGELTGTEPLWIIAAVQESIERTGDIAQATFRKIKDRFPVRLTLSTMHIRDLISKRLVLRKPGVDEQIHQIYERYRQHFPSFACEYPHFLSIYPLHPATLALLEGLGDLFSQHRGIVDFVHSRLAGDPSRKIAGILDRPCMELLAPDSIYDHFESRLAEFSAFHLYPRSVVPHLDEVIDRALEEDADRTLARRLVRILVLYKIHPTAEPPKVRFLAELAACMLAPHDPDLNTQFIAEGILDPIARESRFLTKKTGAPGDPLDATYTIVTEDDPGKTLKARIERASEELLVDDSRLVVGPLAELPESVSWPGPHVLQDVVYRTLIWRQTPRRVLIAFMQKGIEAQLGDRIADALRTGTADGAVVLSLGTCTFQCEHTAIWQIPLPRDEAGTLREFLATRMVYSALRPSNPADAPLIQTAKDALKRLEPAVAQVLLHLIYSGVFVNVDILLEPAARQLRRFDRLLEAGGEYLFEVRYPRFKEIAPRGLSPSPRLYQRLLDEFVVSGRLPLREARTKGLSDAIESLAVPLGLVEVRTGSYILSPDPHEHPFLGYVFSLLRSSETTPMEEVLSQLSTGPYGVPKDTVEFLLTALAQCGLISLLRHGRRVALEFLRMTLLESVDAVAPGELITQADRDTLASECTFIAPAHGWDSFGLRQQRDAWQAAVKFRDKAEEMADEIGKGLTSTAEYAALDSLDKDSLVAKLNALHAVAESIKVSYPAREGLECFLRAWRSSGLSADDIHFLRQTQRFFSQFIEPFIFMVHYIRHRSVERAVLDDEDLATRRKAVAMMLAAPETMVLNDEGAQLNAAFSLFREAYVSYYRTLHAAYYAARDKAELSKFACRALTVLKRLAAVQALDRPTGLEGMVREIEAPTSPPCRRNLDEELMRSPVCGCGFQIGSEPERPKLEDPAIAIEASVIAYMEILRSPHVLEALAARAYALKDMDASTAERLRRLCSMLQHPESSSPVALLDLMDEHTTTELGHALSGNVAVEERPLSQLVTRLSGRRLTRKKVAQVVEEWIAHADEDTVLSIVEDAPGYAVPQYHSVTWWPLLRQDLFKVEAVAVPYPPKDVKAMEVALEKQFPAAGIQSHLMRLDNERLLRFVAEEPCHTRAAQAAWILLAERVLRSDGGLVSIEPRSSHLLPAEAAGIRGRLETLHKVCSLLNTTFPDRLRTRLWIAHILFDPWSTNELQSLAEKAIDTISSSGKDWLAVLPAAACLDLKDRPIIVILEAIPPDVWLEVAASGSLTDPSKQGWFRLETEPKTVSAINVMFGFGKDRDPSDEFSTRGISYHHLEGNESYSITELLPPLDTTSTKVIRLASFDRSAHRDGGRRFIDMPGMLKNVLERHLAPLLDHCAQRGRRLILTTDHGLSLSRKDLAHGDGGVYEQAIFRAEWTFGNSHTGEQL